MSKPEDVVLTVENPVILDEPKSKKPYSLWAIILAFFPSSLQGLDLKTGLPFVVFLDLHHLLFA